MIPVSSKVPRPWRTISSKYVRIYQIIIFRINRFLVDNIDYYKQMKAVNRTCVLCLSTEINKNVSTILLSIITEQWTLHHVSFNNTMKPWLSFKLNAFLASYSITIDTYVALSLFSFSSSYQLNRDSSLQNLRHARCSHASCLIILSFN